MSIREEDEKGNRDMRKIIILAPGRSILSTRKINRDLYAAAH